MSYSEEKIYRKAKKKVKAKKGFYIHFSVYLSMALFFLTMNIIEYDGEIWFYMPLIPWGISILIHYFSVFGLPGGQLSAEWEAREMEKEMDLQRRQQELIEPEPLELPKDELELKEFKKLRKEWDDKDFV